MISKLAQAARTAIPKVVETAKEKAPQFVAGMASTVVVLDSGYDEAKKNPNIKGSILEKSLRGALQIIQKDAESPHAKTDRAPFYPGSSY